MGFHQMLSESDPPPDTVVRVKGEAGQFTVLDYYRHDGEDIGTIREYAARCRSTNNKVLADRFFRPSALIPLKPKRPRRSE